MNHGMGARGVPLASPLMSVSWIVFQGYKETSYNKKEIVRYQLKDAGNWLYEYFIWCYVHIDKIYHYVMFKRCSISPITSERARISHAYNTRFYVLSYPSLGRKSGGEEVDFKNKTIENYCRKKGIPTIYPSSIAIKNRSNI